MPCERSCVDTINHWRFNCISVAIICYWGRGWRGRSEMQPCRIIINKLLYLWLGLDVVNCEASKSTLPWSLIFQFLFYIRQSATSVSTNYKSTLSEKWIINATRNINKHFKLQLALCHMVFWLSGLFVYSLLWKRQPLLTLNKKLNSYRWAVGLNNWEYLFGKENCNYY